MVVNIDNLFGITRVAGISFVESCVVDQDVDMASGGFDG